MNFDWIVSDDVNVARWQLDALPRNLRVGPRWATCCDSWDAWRLAVLIEDRIVGVEEINMPVADPNEHLDFREGGAEHRTLCAQAAVWMRRAGFTPVLKPRVYVGRLADVADPTRRLFVECGFTELHKLLAAMRTGLLWLHVPFPLAGPAVGYLWSSPDPASFPDSLHDVSSDRALAAEQAAKEAMVDEVRRAVAARHPELSMP